MHFVNGIMDRRELLHMSRRFKALHNSLSSSDRLMQTLRSFVQLLVLAMIANAQTYFSFGRTI